MATGSQLSPGMTIAIGDQLYRVESTVKVSAKGAPFIKTKLRDLANDEMIEKNFKPTQEVNEVSVAERHLEYLYLEGKEHIFLDVDLLDQVKVGASVLTNQVNFLKEGVQVTAIFYGDTVFSVELPPFLELTVAKIEEPKKTSISGNPTKMAILETGAPVEVPPFVEPGDIIKVQTSNGEFIQRV